MATYATRLADSLYRRFAGRTYRHKESGRKMTVYGIQMKSEASMVLLVKKRRRQLIPDEWIPRHWLIWVDGAEQIITYRRTCQKCQGGREVPYNDGTMQRGFTALVKCRRCDGTGKVTVTRRGRGTKTILTPNPQRASDNQSDVSAHLPNPMIKINFGAGGCKIDGWHNTDFCYPEGPDKIDITQPLPFATASVDVVFSEMTCEHVSPQQAWSFLCECHRILRPGGLIRIVIPDFCLTLRLKDPDWMRVNQGVTGNDGSLRDQMKSIIFAHGHAGLWNSELMQAVLEAIGFTGTAIHKAGESDRPELRDLEQHWHSVGKAVALSESGCVEGVR